MVNALHRGGGPSNYIRLGLSASTNVIYCQISVNHKF